MPTKYGKGGVDLYPTFTTEEALKTCYKSEAHCVQYYIPDREAIPRVNKGMPEAHQLEIDTILLDFDAPKLFEWEQKQEWADKEMARFAASSISTAHYRTKKGFRAVYSLRSPITVFAYSVVIRKIYEAINAAGFYCDVLPDWTRTFRLPFIVRDGKVTYQVAANLSNIQYVPFKIVEARNTTLTSLGGSIIWEGETKDLETDLSTIDEAFCVPPMGTKEVQDIAKHVERYREKDARKKTLDKAPDGEPILDWTSETAIARYLLASMEYASKHPPCVGQGALWVVEPNNVWGKVTYTTLVSMVCALDKQWIECGVDGEGKAKVKKLEIGKRTAAATAELCLMLQSGVPLPDRPTGAVFADCIVTPRGERLDIKPEHHVTYVPMWEWTEEPPTEFLGLADFVLGGDAQPFYEFVGCALLGVCTEMQQGLILLGDGHNGKSLLSDIVAGLFPEGTITSVPPQDWGNEYYRVQLAGALLNVVEEMPERELLDSASVKMIVSASKEITAREIRQPVFKFKPRTGHWFLANDLPPVKDTKDGFWRRWLIGNCPSKFVTKEKNISRRVLDAEADAIASYCVRQGVKAYTQGGYTQFSNNLLEDWRHRVDHVRSFVESEEMSELLSKGMTGEDLYTKFVQYCAASGVMRLAKETFLHRVKSFLSKGRERDGGKQSTVYRKSEIH